MLVGAIIVHHHVQIQFRGKFAVQTLEKMEKLLMAMAGVALADDLAVRDFQRGKKTGGAVSLIVMGLGAAATFFKRQSRLGAVQGLNLALLIDAENQRLLRGIEVKADDVGEFFQKPHVARQLEVLGAVRLEMVALPNPLDGRLAHALLFGQAAATPVRGARWPGLQSSVNNGFDLAGCIMRLASASRSNLPKTLGALLTKTTPPQRHGLEVDLQIGGNNFVLPSLGRGQNNLTALNHLLGSAVSADPLLQLLAVGFVQNHGRSLS